MYTYVLLPVTPSGCRVLSNRVKVHNTHPHIPGGLTVFTYKNTIFRTFRAPQKRCCPLSLPRNAALLLSPSCPTTTRGPVRCILLDAATSLCCIAMTVEWGSAVVKFMVCQMAPLISGRWVGSLDRSKNGGWAHQPIVYFIVVGGKKKRADTFHCLPC